MPQGEDARVTQQGTKQLTDTIGILTGEAPGDRAQRIGKRPTADHTVKGENQKRCQYTAGAHQGPDLGLAILGSKFRHGMDGILLTAAANHPFSHQNR